MMNTVEEMRRMYQPRTASAITGPIPMHVFEAVETELRKDMRRKGLRVMYRGPRPWIANRAKPSMTLRANATHAVIYIRS